MLVADEVAFEGDRWDTAAVLHLLEILGIPAEHLWHPRDDAEPPSDRPHEIEQQCLACGWWSTCLDAFCSLCGCCGDPCCRCVG